MNTDNIKALGFAEGDGPGQISFSHIWTPEDFAPTAGAEELELSFFYKWGRLNHPSLASPLLSLPPLSLLTLAPLPRAG